MLGWLLTFSQNTRRKEQAVKVSDNQSPKPTTRRKMALLAIPIDLHFPITVVTRHENHHPTTLTISITSGPTNTFETTLTSSSTGGQMWEPRATPTDISQLSWNISGIKPTKKLVLNGGQTILLGFMIKDLKHLNLELPDVLTCNQSEFLGSDILAYLQSSPDFGEVITDTHDNPGCYDGDDDEITHQPRSPGHLGAKSGIMFGALFVALLALGHSTKI